VVKAGKEKEEDGRLRTSEKGKGARPLRERHGPAPLDLANNPKEEGNNPGYVPPKKGVRHQPPRALRLTGMEWKK